MPNHNLDKFFLASIVETSNDSIITIDLDFVITSWNKAAERLYGFPAGDAIGKKLTTLTLPKDFQKLLTKIERLREHREVEVFESERVGKNKDHMILEVVVSPVNNSEGDLIGISTIARDLTSRRLAEKAMHDKELLHRLILAQEDERGRISRDIHDELGQQITALQLTLARFKQECTDPKLKDSLDLLTEITTDIDKSVDFLAWELRPSLVDRVGLVSAIENYTSQWSQHSGVEVEVSVAAIDPRELAPNVDTNLYRIVQESLNNIHKHAAATRVEVILQNRGEEFVVMVSDNGCGFDADAGGSDLKGLGLTGMYERAAAIGAKIETETAPGSGTTVHLTVPKNAKAPRKSIKPSDATEWGDRPPA